jgi:hypothetical protein
MRNQTQTAPHATPPGFNGVASRDCDRLVVGRRQGRDLVPALRPRTFHFWDGIGLVGYPLHTPADCAPCLPPKCHLAERKWKGGRGAWRLFPHLFRQAERWRKVDSSSTTTRHLAESGRVLPVHFFSLSSLSSLSSLFSLFSLFPLFSLFVAFSRHPQRGTRPRGKCTVAYPDKERFRHLSARRNVSGKRVQAPRPEFRHLSAGWHFGGRHGARSAGLCRG